MQRHTFAAAPSAPRLRAIACVWTVAHVATPIGAWAPGPAAPLHALQSRDHRGISLLQHIALRVAAPTRHVLGMLAKSPVSMDSSCKYAPGILGAS